MSPIAFKFSHSLSNGVRLLNCALARYFLPSGKDVWCLIIFQYLNSESRCWCSCWTRCCSHSNRTSHSSCSCCCDHDKQSHEAPPSLTHTPCVYVDNFLIDSRGKPLNNPIRFKVNTKAESRCRRSRRTRCRTHPNRTSQSPRPRRCDHDKQHRALLCCSLRYKSHKNM